MGDMKGMDHGGMASGMLMKNGRYSDEHFIDAMVPHHQVAVGMAQVALDESKNQRIRELATNIVEAQKREISQMKHRREQWYPRA